MPNTKIAPKSAKQPKTVRVSTVVISVAVLIALVISFAAGAITANTYKNKVQAQAIELSSKISDKQ